MLLNELLVIRRGLATLAIVGTGDPAGGRRGSSRAAPDIERAMAQVPSSATTIAFAHNPALWPALAARGVALTLSGHTHWGHRPDSVGLRVAVPETRWARMSQDALLYISRILRDSDSDWSKAGSYACHTETSGRCRRASASASGSVEFGSAKLVIEIDEHANRERRRPVD